MKARLPSLTALRAFEAVCRLQGFKAAAAELNVSRSAISHQIKHLESELDCRLMDRGRGGFALSPHGQILAAAVGGAFRQIDEAAERLRDVGARRITLQVYSTFAVRWLLPRMSRFEEQHPDLEVSLVTSQSDADLRSGEVDACVLIGNPRDKHVDYSFLFSSEVYPACSPDYLDRNPALRRPQDLQNHTLLQVYPSENDWSVWLKAAGVGQIDASGDSRFDSYDHALKMAAEGLGIALAIEPFAQDDLRSGRLVEVFPGQRVELPRNWYFACLGARKDIGKIVALRNWINAEVASDTGQAAQS